MYKLVKVFQKLQENMLKEHLISCSTFDHQIKVDPLSNYCINNGLEDSVQFRKYPVEKKIKSGNK